MTFGWIIAIVRTASVLNRIDKYRSCIINHYKNISTPSGTRKTEIGQPPIKWVGEPLIELSTRGFSHALLVARRAEVLRCWRVHTLRAVLTMTQWPWSIKDTRRRGGFYSNLGAIRIFAIRRSNDDNDQYGPGKSDVSDVFKGCRNVLT